MTTTRYQTSQPTAGEVSALAGDTLLDFGTDWCGHCNAARPHVQAALAARPGVRHLKAEDGPGRPLGRAFRVKVWPTLVALKNGKEVARTVRPTDADEVRRVLAALDA